MRAVVDKSGQVKLTNYKPAATRNYEADLQQQAKLAMRGRTLFTGPVRMSIIAAFAIPKSWSKARRHMALTGHIRPTKKPDADNIAKTADALNGVVFADDAYVVDLRVAKWFSETPELEIVVESMDALPMQDNTKYEAVAERPLAP